MPSSTTGCNTRHFKQNSKLGHEPLVCPCISKGWKSDAGTMDAKVLVQVMRSWIHQCRWNSLVEYIMFTITTRCYNNHANGAPTPPTPSTTTTSDTIVIAPDLNNVWRWRPLLGLSISSQQPLQTVPRFSIAAPLHLDRFAQEHTYRRYRDALGGPNRRATATIHHQKDGHHKLTMQR